MNWIRPAKRLAIYLRDGLACVWCGEGIEDGAKLTLDHILPHSRGGKNGATNLVTACHRCNSARGARTLAAFADAAASYLDHDVQASTIVARIQIMRRRPLDVPAAKALMSRRGGFTAALKG